MTKHNHSGAGAFLLGAALGGAMVNRASRSQPRTEEVVIVQQGSNGGQQQPIIASSSTAQGNTIVYVQQQQNQPHYRHLHRPNQPTVVIMNNGVTLRAPGWRLAHHCGQCQSAFTLFNRRHHCRNCGRSICGRHSNKALPLPHFGYPNFVRVCDACHDHLIQIYRSGQPIASPPIPVFPSSTHYAQHHPGMHPPPPHHHHPPGGPSSSFPPVQPYQPSSYQTLPQASPIYEPVGGGGGGGAAVSSPSPYYHPTTSSTSSQSSPYAAPPPTSATGGGNVDANLYMMPSATAPGSNSHYDYNSNNSSNKY